MTHEKYTPAPWHHSPELSRTGCELVYAGDKHLVANVGSFSRSDEENRANARLIAVAPELLEALEALLPYAENEAEALEELKDGPEAEAEAVRAWEAVEVGQKAIAKATERAA